MYPALSKLEEKGLISGVENEDEKRRYELTDAGRQRIAKRDPAAPLPWSEEVGRSGSPLRSLLSEIAGQIRQIGRFGTDDQRTEAHRVLSEAKSELYRVLANDSKAEEPTD